MRLMTRWHSPSQYMVSDRGRGVKVVPFSLGTQPRWIFELTVCETKKQVAVRGNITSCLHDETGGSPLPGSSSYRGRETVDQQKHQYGRITQCCAGRWQRFRLGFRNSTLYCFFTTDTIYGYNQWLSQTLASGVGLRPVAVQHWPCGTYP